jgi:hypothetical protein
MVRTTPEAGRLCPPGRVGANRSIRCRTRLVPRRPTGREFRGGNWRIGGPARGGMRLAAEFWGEMGLLRQAFVDLVTGRSGIEGF